RSGAAVIGSLGGLVGVATGAGLAYALNPWVGLPVGATVAMLAVWQAARRQLRVKRAWASGHRVLTRHEDRGTFGSALWTALRAWPALRARISLDDPSPTLARSLWDLSAVLARREPVRETHERLAQVARDVPTDSPVHADVAARLAQVEQTRRRLDTDIERRL